MIILYMVNPQEYYFPFLVEDGLAEWLTFAMLSCSFAVSLYLFLKKRAHENRWFFLLFSMFCLFGALEEISWGQRVFDIQSSEFFVNNSDQGEINAHNVFQKWFRIKTKHVAGIVLLVYGMFLPTLANRRPAIKKRIEKQFFLLPPLHLRWSFLLGTLMMMDWPTGQEEELGEMSFSICLFLFLLYELQWEETEQESSKAA